MASTSRSTVGFMRRLTAVLFASFALVACGDDDGGEGLTAGDAADVAVAVEDAPACDELYAEGNVIEGDQHMEPCIDEGGEATFVPTLSETCTDGRKLLWNDRGWWFEGEPVSEGESPGCP